MAVTATTLAADLSASSLNPRVTSTTGATVGGIMKINEEYAVITALSPTLTIRRTGDNGSAVVAHDILSPVTFCLSSDLIALGATELVPTPLAAADIISVGENGIIPAPKRDTIYFLTKATALASTTFADPSATQDGLRVQFVSLTNAAHVITTVNEFDGTTGAHTTNTFAAFTGASYAVVAAKGGWYTTSVNAVTIT